MSNETQARQSVVRSLRRASKTLYRMGPAGEDAAGRMLLMAKAQKPKESAADSASSQRTQRGTIPHPFDMQAVADYKAQNTHHSTCIDTKVAATIGVGFVSEDDETVDLEEVSVGEKARRQQRQSKVDTVLNPLCDISFMDVLLDVGEDFYTPQVGYIEAVREKPGGKITGLHHVPAASLHKRREPDGYNYHFVQHCDEFVAFDSDLDAGDPDKHEQRYFPVFGDSEDFIARNPDLNIDPGGKISEIIAFRQPSALSKDYSFPSWMAAVPAIELSQAIDQQTFDFFFNRCVPELMVTILGTVDEAIIDEIETALLGTSGLGQNHKSLVVNIKTSPENVEFTVDKLGAENGDEEQFATLQETLATRIVSAHRVPPLLAGILIPGKLGATNELPNAMMAFQALVCGPHQKNLKETLACTLGNPKLNGGLDLGPEDFVFRRIVDQMNLGAMDTVARQRETVVESEQKGRDPEDGVKQ